MNPVQKAILDRRSTRGFDKKPLTWEELHNLVDAALASPSAVNRQPWHFAFVTDQKLLGEVNQAARTFFADGPMTARFADPDYELLMGAPLLVIISAEKGNTGFYPKIDCGIAVENLALSAMGMDLGSVIVGMPRDLVEAEANKDLKARLGIPEGNEYIVGILIGHNTVTKEAHPIGENKYVII